MTTFPPIPLYSGPDCSGTPLVPVNGVPQACTSPALQQCSARGYFAEHDRDGPTSTASADLTVTLNIRGIADAPAPRQVTDVATEDVDYDLSVLNVPDS